MKRIPGSYPDAHTQLFGGVLQPGRIQDLDFMTLIGYLSSYNLLGDRGTSQYYQRIQGKKEHLAENPSKTEAEGDRAAEERLAEIFNQ